MKKVLITSIVKQYPPLTLRLRNAYQKLSYGERVKAKDEFCIRFDVKRTTARHKFAGYYSVAESEVVWMEQYVESKLQLVNS